ncbi:MAG: hypothetical protein HUJ28_00020 [Chromatiales bacterium]|nr:hypothetical protein [Chromatiales bacterium]
MTKLIVRNIQYILIIIGLACILVANIFEKDVLKVDVDNALANIGVMLLVFGAIQWVFDVGVRKQLFEEITALTVKNIHVATSGIIDVVQNSRDVDYSDLITQSTLLTIGLNYTPRIFEDYLSIFKERSRRGMDTNLIVIDFNSDAGSFLLGMEKEAGHVVPNQDKLRRIIEEINNIGDGKIRVLSHSAVLRYSFVQGDSSIWVKPYRNSNGRDEIPAIQLKKGTWIYDFFSSDISALIGQAQKNE